MPQSDCALDVPRRTCPSACSSHADAGGGWQGTTCSIVAAGELVAEGGEVRGGGIKIVIGILILGLVLSWALRRRARGTRPQLPGAPEP